MSKKNDIKVCRYENCSHGGTIDITKDDYRIVGRYMYYHSDCLTAKKKGEHKDEQTKADLQYIKNQWVLHISKTVVFSQLMRCLNELLARGISSDYLVFTMDYVVQHKMNLRYPMGFKYFVNKPFIKEAYKKQQKSKQPQVNYVVKDNQDNSPNFSFNQKPQGFGGILGGNKD